MELVVLLLSVGSALLPAEGAELAVVRPFASQEEAAGLVQSFDSWSTHLPCTLGLARSVPVDLFLVYSRSLADSAEAAASATAIVRDFGAKTSSWHACFRAVHVLQVNLSAADDIYDPMNMATNLRWVVGPNNVFRFLLRHFVGNKYDAFFLMEMDSVPKRANWLDQFEVEALTNAPMAVRGSRYRGDNWDNFLSKMPVTLLEHVNGNAIYNASSPVLSWLSKKLDEDRGGPNDTTAYDVRIAELLLEATPGKPQESATSYRSDSVLVGNYANTLVNVSFDGGEFISHNSVGNFFEELSESEVTLAVSHFSSDNYSVFNDSLSTMHPFRQILMLTQMNGTPGILPDGSTEVVATSRGPSTVTWKHAQKPGRLALCELANLVQTKWFVLTDTFHAINSPVSILMDGDRPVLPRIHSNSTFCQENNICRASIQMMTSAYGASPPHLYDNFDTLYETTLVKSYCSDWETRLPPEAWDNCSKIFSPTANEYIAYSLKQRSTALTDLFRPEPREMKGWRPWTTLHTAHPPDMRACAVYTAEERQRTVRSISACVEFVEKPGSCNAHAACMWRPIFQSGKCIPSGGYSLAPPLLSKVTTQTVTNTETVTTTSTITVTTAILSDAGSVLVPTNTSRITETAVGQFLQELRQAASTVKHQSPHRDVIPDPEVHIELTEESSIQLDQLPSESDIPILLNSARAARCGSQGRDVCDVQLPNSTVGLKAQTGLRGATRRLASYPFNFVVFIVIKSAQDMVSTQPLRSPGFEAALRSALAQANATNASSAVISSLLAVPVVNVTAPLSSALSVMSIAVPPSIATATLTAIQAHMTNATVVTAALLQSAGGTAAIIAPLIVDLCHGRTCGGNGACSAGICTCNANWQGVNCLIPLAPPSTPSPSPLLAAPAPPLPPPAAQTGQPTPIGDEDGHGDRVVLGVALGIMGAVLIAAGAGAAFVRVQMTKRHADDISQVVGTMDELHAVVP